MDNMPDDEILKDAPKRPRARARAHRYHRWNRLLHWNDLPDYLRDNEYIVTGYRANAGILGAIKSLFRIHNESGNIWTHLLGATCSARRIAYKFTPSANMSPSL